MYEGKYLPIAVFLLFCGIVVGATLTHSPGWGLMDDASNLDVMKKFWSEHNKISAYFKLIMGDLEKNGRLRPVYYLWVVSVYRIFFRSPVLLYVLIFFINMSALLLWGRILCKLFPDRAKFPAMFFFPLACFLFTPLWNTFMYISTIEKFVLIFMGLSLYFHIKSYEEKKLTFWVVAVVFALLGVLSKETAVSLLMAYFIFSILDISLLKKNPRISRITCVTVGILLACYVFFIKGILGGYTALYSRHLNVSAMMRNARTAPAVIKGLFFLSLAIGIWYFSPWMKKKTVSEQFLLIPLCLLLFIVILIPWRFSNYLLAPLAPLVIILIYPLWVQGGSAKWLVWSKRIFVSVCVFPVLFSIIIPRISAMADVRKMVTHVSTSPQRPGVRYFFPQPFFESALSVEKLTGKKVIYLAEGVLKSSALTAESYLIFGHECAGVMLQDVSIKEEVFSNNKWKIFSLRPLEGARKKLHVTFPKNRIQKIKDFIKKL